MDQSRLKGKRILVVEDQEINWFLIRDLLEYHQPELTWAEYGPQAIDLISAGNKYDAILMDINLPGMDGYETTRKIKEIRSEIPIVAQTAFALEEEITKCYEAGCNAHILKPLSEKDLVGALLSILYPFD